MRKSRMACIRVRVSSASERLLNRVLRETIRVLNALRPHLSCAPRRTELDL